MSKKTKRRKQDKPAKLLELLNKTIKAVTPIKYEDFNKIYSERAPLELFKLERKNKKLGVRRLPATIINDTSCFWGISTLTLISTITDVLINKRLSFTVDGDGYITGVAWFVDKKYKGE